jgi:putative Ca2+/H+ antiporter (TMEM165/GDT1 family)
MMAGRSALALYLAAAVIYVTLGMFFPRTILSWVEGAAFLLLAVWIVPAIVMRLRR